MADLQIGMKREESARVEESVAINFLAAGGPRVLATPAMIMSMEMVCRNLVKAHLDDGYDTVGTHVDVKHLAATPIGMQVTYSCELVDVNGRHLRFRVEAHDEKEKVGEGFHGRAIINIAKFGEKVKGKSGSTKQS